MVRPSAPAQSVRFSRITQWSQYSHIHNYTPFKSVKLHPKKNSPYDTYYIGFDQYYLIYLISV